MKKILIISIFVFLAGCAVNRKGEEYDMRLQKIYQQFSNLEKEFPGLPQITKDNENIIKEKLIDGKIKRASVYIEHIQQPENKGKAFLYTYLNGVFNNGNHEIVDYYFYPSQSLQSILPQITSGTNLFKTIVFSGISVPVYAIMDDSCVDTTKNYISYKTIFFATGLERQKIITLKNEREGHGINEEAVAQYGILLTGYEISGDLVLQWYNLDEISMDNNILLGYCNGRIIEYRNDNNYQGRHLPFEVIQMFSDLAKNNKWEKVEDMIRFFNKFSIDPTPFGGRYTKIVNYSDIKVVNNGILFFSYMGNIEHRTDKKLFGSLTGLAYMFSQGQRVFMLYLNLNKYNTNITSIQDFQNKYPQDYKNFIDIVNKPIYLDYERKH